MKPPELVYLKSGSIGRLMRLDPKGRAYLRTWYPWNGEQLLPLSEIRGPVGRPVSQFPQPRRAVRRTGKRSNLEMLKTAITAALDRDRGGQP